MRRLVCTATSSIGTKWVMALTGLGLVGFVIAHMLGNLQVFLGPEALNAYAENLQSLGPVLWAMRGGLLGMFLLHMWAAARVTRANRQARPEAYRYGQDNQKSSYAGRTMFMSGMIVLAFVVYHLLHFTFGVVQPDTSATALAGPGEVPDVYGMVIAGFRNPLVAISYVVANVILAVHISHGASSAFQTLGITHPALGFLRSGFGKAVGAVIGIGNVAMPLAVLTGIVK